MFNTILSWFGFGHKETVEDSPPTTEKYYAGARRTLALNQKKYYRRGNKFYIRKHAGFDFDLDDEILDLILLELLIMEYDQGNISSYEDIQENVETVDDTVENILDVDINTIPVEDTLSMIDTPAQVEMVEKVIETVEPATSFHEELTTPQPEYREPETASVAAYCAPEPTPSYSSSSAGSSYSSGSSDYSSSSSDSGSSSCDSSSD